MSRNAVPIAGILFLARWLAVYAAGLMLPIFPAVYIELFPRRVQESPG